MKTTKIAASVLATAMIMSMTGCSMLGGGKAKQEVIDAADSFASNICALKASKVTAAMADLDDDKAAEIEFAFEAINSDDILSVIAGTLAYEIDEDSVEVDSKKGEASVDVVFTYVDANSVYEDVIADGGDEAAFIDALEDCDDVVEVEVTYEFTLEDDEWLVNDSKLKTFEKIFVFCSDAEAYEFGADFMEAYEGYSWWGADSDDTYADASYIDFWATYDYSMIDDEVEFYFTVEHDGVLVYTSDVTYSCDCYFYASDYTGEDVLPEGSYTVTLYLADGTLVDSGSTYVYVSDDAQTPVVAGDVDTETYWADPNSDWSDTISLWGWYDSNNGTFDFDGFYSNGDYVEYDLGTDDTSASALYYAFYLLPDGTAASADYSNPVADGTINFTGYNDGNFYECGMGYATSGTYLVIVAESEDAWDEGYGDWLCYSMCSVS
ncbi:MAG: hypothetical protein MJ094_04215 [Saccharofermentans sp.]|nr:hypothetical protein [Saccharofermentans sp.]